MSRWLDKLEDETYKIEIESMDICKWRINEICCNDKCEELGDYPYPAKCESKEKCEYFEKEDGKELE